MSHSEAPALLNFYTQMLGYDDPALYISNSGGGEGFLPSYGMSSSGK